MRKRNWRQYNKSLIERGSLTFLIDPKVMKTLLPKKKKSVGRPLQFSNALIQILLIVKVHFKLPYRMLEGFLRFLLPHIDKSTKVPTYSLICKRAKGIEMPMLSSRQPTTIIFDASGCRIEGEGEWKVKVHGKGRPRKWVKIHLVIDAKTQEIIAEALTEAYINDGKAFPRLFEQVPNRVKTVIADGAYDGKEVRELIERRGCKALIPPPRNGVCHDKDLNRNAAIQIIHAFGGDRLAKSLWGKLTGYSQRSLVEATFSRYKRIFGDKCFSRTRERQALEIRLKCFLLNKMIRQSA